MNDWVSPVLFFIAATVGYRLVSDVPSLLHTPLMSGMNALSGVTVSGAVIATAFAVGTRSQFLGAIAIVLATVNVVGGFLVTERMLRLFKQGRS